ncbi:YaiI/YqxD family protein [Barrientosiimonas marina]|uniref:UPF0178 protein ACFQU8_05990 n=1 Tax=Lentibacillus kimchii TaxID=1542911 RepID=A0ABW2UVX3_9BACI
MKVYVDADACPVKQTIMTIAGEFAVPVVIVKSFSHFSPADDPAGVETVYVDTGAEAADYRIMQLVQTGDIIITQDYGLASLGLAKDCTVLHHKGFAYTNTNIDQLLQTRYLNAMARKSGKRTKGPKAFTSEDEAAFSRLFRETLDARLA